MVKSCLVKRDIKKIREKETPVVKVRKKLSIFSSSPLILLLKKPSKSHDMNYVISRKAFLIFNTKVGQKICKSLRQKL